MFRSSRQKESHARSMRGTKYERLSRKGRKCWSTVAQLGQEQGHRTRAATKVGRNQTATGLQGPFPTSDRGRFLEIDAAWII